MTPIHAIETLASTLFEVVDKEKLDLNSSLKAKMAHQLAQKIALFYQELSVSRSREESNHTIHFGTELAHRVSEWIEILLEKEFPEKTVEIERTLARADVSSHFRVLGETIQNDAVTVNDLHNQLFNLSQTISIEFAKNPVCPQIQTDVFTTLMETEPNAFVEMVLALEKNHQWDQVDWNKYARELSSKEQSQLMGRLAIKYYQELENDPAQEKKFLRVREIMYRRAFLKALAIATDYPPVTQSQNPRKISDSGMDDLPMTYQAPLDVDHSKRYLATILSMGVSVPQADIFFQNNLVKLEDLIVNKTYYDQLEICTDAEELCDGPANFMIRLSATQKYNDDSLNPMTICSLINCLKEDADVKKTLDDQKNKGYQVTAEGHLIFTGAVKNTTPKKKEQSVEFLTQMRQSFTAVFMLLVNALWNIIRHIGSGLERLPSFGRTSVPLILNSTSDGHAKFIRTIEEEKDNSQNVSQKNSSHKPLKR